MSYRLFLVLIGLAVTITAQTFNSGSTGADGPLTFQPNAGTIIFDPATLNPPLAANHGPVYNFTTITIPTGTTVKLTQRVLGISQSWLATGAVNIAGILDLSGEDGVNGNTTGIWLPAVPGPGGFSGGAGGSTAGGRPASPGLGSGGGAAGNATVSNHGQGGAFSGNDFLVPLFGGSGGGGGFAGTPNMGPSGGGGGGAILIASSDSITITGSVSAAGGKGGNQSGGGGIGGGGSGGAIRLMAPKIQGNGALSVAGGLGGNGNSGTYAGSNGRVRIEAFQHLYSFNVNGGPAISSSPFDTFITSTNQTAVRVISVANVSVRQNPTGNFEMPDVAFNNAGNVDVVIETTRVPLTAPMKLQIFSEDGPDKTVDVPVRTATATPDVARATIQVSFPTGFSRGFLRATFTQ